jgi:NEDD8-activating enzyme E1 regulatory subunit
MDRLPFIHNPLNFTLKYSLQLEKDTDNVWAILQQLAEEYGQTECPEQLTKDHAKEIVRYGGGELHTISALIGGVAAQEAVKIVTHQYVPMDNTYIYNGIVGSGDTYQL